MTAVDETAPSEGLVGHQFLEGNFAPIPHETTAYSLQVTGSLPPSLAGRFVRNGPNPIAPDPEHYHWFLGDGMLHGVELRDGKAVSYRSRWVVTNEVAAYSSRAPRPAAEGGVIPGPGNTNIVHHAGSMWALCELSLPWQITPELDTVRQHSWGGAMPAGMTAHPKIDPVTGELHVMAYTFADNLLRYHVVSADGLLTRSEEIELGASVMVHDMGLTQRYAVALDLPVVFDLDLIMQGYSMPYRWDDNYQPRVGLMPRNGTGADTIWFEVDPCYVFHPLNAYDDGDTVVMDVARHPDMFKLSSIGPVSGPPRLERWRFDMESGTFSSETVSDRPMEFPRADERLATLQHRYGYGAGSGLEDFGSNNDTSTSALKFDLELGTEEVFEFGPGRKVGELVFVPDADDAGEDEGWLMGLLHDRSIDRSSLVVLDATNIAAGPVAEVHLPVRVPSGFHGNWIPDRSLHD
jgi:carotenoid cleavage dioxygenase